MILYIYISSYLFLGKNIYYINGKELVSNIFPNFSIMAYSDLDINIKATNFLEFSLTEETLLEMQGQNNNLPYLVTLWVGGFERYYDE